MQREVEVRRRRALAYEAVVVPLAVANCVAALLLPCYSVFHLKVRLHRLVAGFTA
jgi:hypothetical protein